MPVLAIIGLFLVIAVIFAVLGLRLVGRASQFVTVLFFSVAVVFSIMALFSLTFFRIG
jgi:hypothetical protein